MSKHVKKRRVMLVTMNGDGPTTGFAVRVIMIGKTLAEAGFEVTLLRLYPIFRSQGSWRNHLLNAIELIETPVLPTARFPLLRKISFVLSNFIVTLISKIKAIDVIQAEAHEAGLAVLQRKPSDTLVIVDFHGAAPEESPSNQHRSELHWLETAEVTCLQKADAALVVSPRMIDHLKIKHPDKRLPEFFLVPVNVEDIFFKKYCKTSARKKLGFNHDHIVYVYNGGAQGYQCIYETASLFSQLRRRNENSRLLIISTQRNEFQQVLKTVCPEYMNEIVITSASKEEMPDLLVAGDLGFLLRKQNVLNDVSCPTKFGEYLACGLSVITTPWAGHAPNVVQAHGVGVIVTFELESDLDLIETFARNLSENLSEHCSYIARSTMHWASSASNLLKCHDFIQASKESVIDRSSRALL